MLKTRLGYVNIHTRDLDRSIAFFRDRLGLTLKFSEPSLKFAGFDAGPVQFGIAEVDPADAEQMAHVGQHTGIGFWCEDLDEAHAELQEKGVTFTVAPERYPWGAYMALFEDPDGNVYYLDEIRDGHREG